MMSILARTAVLTGLFVLPAIPALAQTAAPSQPVKLATQQCMLDDGYGRLRSCSQGYKRANPGWRNSDACYTDDGYGRYRSCEAGGVGFKRKTKG